MVFFLHLHSTWHQLTVSDVKNPKWVHPVKKQSSCRVATLITAGRCELRAFGIEVKELLAGAILGRIFLLFEILGAGIIWTLWVFDVFFGYFLDDRP